MKSIKAIAAGSLFIIFVFLLMQLAYIFIAVGYNSIAEHYPFLNEISGYFRYFIGIPAFMLTMYYSRRHDMAGNEEFKPDIDRHCHIYTGFSRHNCRWSLLEKRYYRVVQARSDSVCQI